MKLHYYAETDSLYVELKAGPELTIADIQSKKLALLQTTALFLKEVRKLFRPRSLATD